MAVTSCSCLAGNQNVLGSLSFWLCFLWEVLAICLRCHSPALWGFVAFSWWLGKEPPEPEGIVVLDDKGHQLI